MVAVASDANITVYGRTLSNLLGRDGGFDSGVASSWISGTMTSSRLDTGSAISGTYGMLMTATDIGASYYIEKRINFLQDGKYYLLLASIKNSTVPVSTRFRFLDTNVGGTLNIAKTGNTISTKGTSYVKLSPSEYSAVNQIPASACSVQLRGVTTAIGQTTSFDEYRVYEITADEYAKIDVDPDWTGEKLADRFPYVDNTKYLQGVGVKKSGKNLVPQFNDSAWTIHANAVVTGQYDLTLNATGSNQDSTVTVPVIPNQQYYFSITKSANANVRMRWLDSTGTLIGSETYNQTTLTAPATAVSLRLGLYANTSGTYTFSNMQLEIGSVATPFEPYNADYINIPVALASSVDGSVRDSAYVRDGLWYKHEKWATGVKFDPANVRQHNGTTSVVGSKRTFFTTVLSASQALRQHSKLIRFDGVPINYADPASNIESFLVGSDSLLYMSVPNTLTGFGDLFVPADADWKAYFNGWKMNKGTLGTPYTNKYIANYVGKIAGSTVENPHNVRSYTTFSALQAPATTGGSIQQASFDAIMALDGSSYTGANTSASGTIAQSVFSFDLISTFERLGLTLGATLTDKVTWLKTNLVTCTANWHGFGSGPSGNKVTFQHWYAGGSAWATNNTVSHTNSTITKLSNWTSPTSDVDSNGFVHFIAYADASDGTTASLIRTDYIELELELNLSVVQKYWTALESPRANFVGKVSGSIVDNPHIAYRSFNAFSTSAGPGSAGFGEISDSTSSTHNYPYMRLMDGQVSYSSTTTNGANGQHLFSFNLIEHVLRKYGAAIFNGATTVADRVTWLKANVGRVAANWYGYGSGPTGSKATLYQWGSGSLQWWSSGSHTNGSVTKITTNTTSVSDRIDSNGFYHYLAVADSSNGTVASTIYTEFIDLEVELNVKTLPATGLATTEFTPYSLDYVVATPIEEYIPGGEGVISLSKGGNQIELFEGVVVREKATLNSRTDGRYSINNKFAASTTPDTASYLKNRAGVILAVYKNGTIDPSFIILNNNTSASTNGTSYALAPNDPSFDPTAEYTVTYTALDKHLYTVNAVDAKLEYHSTQASVQNAIVQNVADNTTQIEILVRSMAEMYKRVKALGG